MQYFFKGKTRIPRFKFLCLNLGDTKCFKNMADFLKCFLPNEYCFLKHIVYNKIGCFFLLNKISHINN